MPTVQRSFAVDPPPPAVVEYLMDFSHTEQWDPGTQECVQIGSGPIGVGTTWRNTSKVGASTTELTYALTELGPNRLVFAGENDTVTTTDTITVEPAGSGSQITYHAELTLKGIAKVAAPLAKLGLEKLGHDTEKQLVRTLNNL